jgi:endonuclease/exonuclease/phosphatase family metal-dependent hydrolase
VRVVTWNLQGNRGLDAAGVAAVLRELVVLDHDTIVLTQEIQRGQSLALQAALGAPCRRWSFKHWGVRVAPEGLCAFAWSPIHVRTRTLSRGVPPWGWQRRIAQLVQWHDELLVNTHLATGPDGTERARQVERLRASARRSPSVLVGDWNESDGPATAALAASGLHDAWSTAHRDAPCRTNWSSEDRSDPPEQLLDRIWLAERCTIRRVTLADWRAVAPLSDHLPVVAEFDDVSRA